MGVTWCLFMVLICIFLMTSDVQVYFHVVLGHLCPSWRNIYSASLLVHKLGCLFTTVVNGLHTNCLSGV